MVEGLSASACGFHKDAQIFNHFALTGEIVKGKGAQGIFKVALGHCRSLLFGTNVEGVFCHTAKVMIFEKIGQKRIENVGIFNFDEMGSRGVVGESGGDAQSDCAKGF